MCVSFWFLNVRLRAEHPGRSLVGHRHHDNGTLYLLLRRFFSFIISSFFQYSGEFHRPFLSDIIITSNLFPEYFFFIFFIQFPIHHDVLIHFFDMQIKTQQYETTGGLRRYGTQNVRGNVCRCPLRFGWRVDHRPAGPCHRLQFLNVLQPHAGNYAIHLFVLL